MPKTYRSITYQKYPPGTKVRFVGASDFHKLNHVNMASNAELNLQNGNIYTIKKIKPSLHGTIITLVESGDTEYMLGFFEKLPPHDASEG